MNLGSQRYRLTPKGRACVDRVESGEQADASLSHYLRDVLMLCGSGVWFEQLRQCMPPRSLEQSLESLLALGLIERLPPENAAAAVQPPAPSGIRRQ